MSKYTKDDIRRICKEEDIKYIRMQFTDMLGLLKNVEIPINRLEDALNNEVMFDGSSIEGFVRVHEADMYLHADLDTFLILTYEDDKYGKVARFLCDVFRPLKDGSRVPFEGDPRGILKRNVEFMKEMGYSAFNAGLEPEFFLFKLDESGEPTLKYNDEGGYFDIAPIDTGVDCRRDIVLELTKLGYTVEAAHHECAPGQHEINFKFNSALEAADAVQTFKLVVKNVARKHGLHATFMPKPVAGIAGSGMHCNCSLVDKNGKNVFFDPNTPNQLSEICNKWVSGILTHARGFCFITNPTINSYKRIVPGFEAPCYISWSDSNRTTLIRIPASRGGKTRTEVRSVDCTANPYLALAVILRAGLDGIAGNCPDVAPVYDNLFKCGAARRKELGVTALPENLKVAIDCFQKDKLICDAVGPHIVEKMVEAKSLEWDDFRRSVSEWEIKRYINRY